MNQILLRGPIAKLSKSVNLPLVIIVMIGALLRFRNLGAESLWVDEGATWEFVHQPFTQLWGAAAAGETNPPLYYTLQKIWLIFGESEAALRSLSAVIGTLTILLIYGLGRALGGRWLGVIAAALLATSDINIMYSQEARAYALFTAAATVAIWGLASLLKNPSSAVVPLGQTLMQRLRYPQREEHRSQSSEKSSEKSSDLAWFAYIFGITIALYSHNTAVLLLILTNIIALIWWITLGHLREQFFWNWMIANFIPLFFYAWWLPILIQQSTGTDSIAWIPFPTTEIVIKTLNSLYGDSRKVIFANLLIALVLLLGVWKWRNQPTNLLLTASFVVGAPLLGILLSFYQSIFITRIFLWTTIPFFLLLAAGSLIARNKYFVIVLVCILIGLHLQDTRNYYRSYIKEPWNQVVAEIKPQLAQGDAILLYVTYEGAFSYYFGEPPQIDIPYYDLPEALSEVPAELTRYTQKYNRIFLVTRRLDAKDQKNVIVSTMKHDMRELQHRTLVSNTGQLDWFLFEKPHQTFLDQQHLTKQ